MWVVGRGALSVEVAFRFLLADVNLKRKAWYDERLFQVNNAQIYKAGEPGRSTVSVRRDLGYTLNVPAEFGATADARVASVAAGRIGVPSAPQRGGATICPP